MESEIFVSIFPWVGVTCNLKLQQQESLYSQTWGRIFSQAGNELGVSSFLARNELFNAFPLYLVPSCERACSQID
jgi:hypothetical protein